MQHYMDYYVWFYKDVTSLFKFTNLQKKRVQLAHSYKSTYIVMNEEAKFFLWIFQSQQFV